MKNRMSFTKASIEAIKPPSTGQRIVFIDTKQAGLQCRVTDTGVKTFSVFRRIKGGLPERITIGRFPDITVEKARREAEKVNGIIAEGKSLAQVKRLIREELTFASLFKEYLKYSKSKKRTWYVDEANYRLYLEKPLGNKKISSITRQDITAIHTSISAQVKNSKAAKENIKYKSGATANRILSLISAIFNWAIRLGHCENNFAKGVKKNSERSRDRFLQNDEFPKFFKSLEDESNIDIRDYIMVALLTGARRMNILAMQWNEISFERKEWRIPRTKNDEPQTIPLIKEALQLLLTRKKKNSSVYVFPSDSKTGHLIETKRGWKRILNRAGIKDLRVHDLRRTLGSWQAIIGSSTLIIGKSLGHKSQQSTAIYARLNIDPIRKSIEKATFAMFNAGKKKLHKKEWKIKWP